jgi:hypothetical protein
MRKVYSWTVFCVVRPYLDILEGELIFSQVAEIGKRSIEVLLLRLENDSQELDIWT